VTAIRLEPLRPDHRAVWEELILDPDVQRFTSVPEPLPPGYVEEWMARYEEGRRGGTREAFLVLDVHGGQALGIGVAIGIDRPGRTVELGYAVLPGARGRGVATATLRAMTAWARSELGAIRVELRIDPANEASKRVAERCGFEREGVLRAMPIKPGRWGDLEVWSLVAGG
jgi:RimJ/RimL family protein N-acetyltransferase